MSKAGTMRLNKEFKTLAKEYVEQIKNSKDGQIQDNFIAAPEENNVFIWHFVIFGLPDEPYKGGYYMGKLQFPHDYPWKPPSIMMTSENGRFSINHRICLSISDYHPESWNPVWPVRSIIIGLISFFVTDATTVGSITTSFEERQRITRESRNKILKNKKFIELFATMKENIGLEEYTGNQIISQMPKPVQQKVKPTADQQQKQIVYKQTAIVNELEEPKDALKKPLLADEEQETAIPIQRNQDGPVLVDEDQEQRQQQQAAQKRKKCIIAVLGCVVVVGVVIGVIVGTQKHHN